MRVLSVRQTELVLKIAGQQFIASDSANEAAVDRALFFLALQ